MLACLLHGAGCIADSCMELHHCYFHILIGCILSAKHFALLIRWMYIADNFGAVVFVCFRLRWVNRIIYFQSSNQIIVII